MTPIPFEAVLRRLLYRGLKKSSPARQTEYRERSQQTCRTKFNWRIRRPKGDLR